MTTLFGPVLWYDMVRSSRRTSIVLLRSLYPLILFSVLAATYGEILGRNFFASEVLDAIVLARISYAFYITFLLIQWVAVFVLTPIYVGSAIADEKDRRTLEYIFTTDLRNREIVLGKLMSRLAVLMLILLAGLPLLSIMQLLGGVSPDLLWSGFAATALTMLSLSGISMYWSVHCRNSREAILLTFLTIVLYFAIYFVVLVPSWIIFGQPVRFPSLDSFDWEAALGLGAWGLASGNPFHAIYDLANAAGTAGGRGYGGVLIVWLVRYAVFHGLSFVLFISLAILQVRSAYVRQAYGAARRTKSLTVSPASRWRLAIGNWPMIWKELLTDGGILHGAAAKVMSRLLALSILAITGAVFVLRLRLDSVSANVLTALFFGLLLNAVLVTMFMRGWARIGLIACFTVIVGASLCAFSLANPCFVWWSPSSHPFDFVDVLPRLILPWYVALIWFVTCIQAAYSINVEREKQTLDVLLATPLTEKEILAGKWIGSMCYARWLIAILLTIWFLEVCAGLLHPLGFLASVAAFTIYLALFSSIGLFCGTLVRSSLGAGMLAGLVCLFLMGAHLFVTVPFMMALPYLSGPSGDYIITAFLTTTPTVVMGFAHVNGWELEIRRTSHAHDFSSWVALFCILWTLIWALVSSRLYGGAVQRFRARCGRITMTEPRSPRQSALTVSARHAMVGRPIQSRVS